MKLLFSLFGAVIGGFPGAVLAFAVAVRIDGGEVFCEVFCRVVTVGLAIVGAMLGTAAAKAIRGERNIRLVDEFLPTMLGLICGLTGYECLMQVLGAAG
jgi:hypothetical protein